MSKLPLEQVRECLLELDELSIKRQELYDQAWLLEKRAMDVRMGLHKIINGKAHL